MTQQLGFRLDRGIAQYNINDHFAVLGSPVTADATQIRKQYLKIAKHLHPDVYGRPTEDKEKATQYLSKLVSPAYSMLMQGRERAEYSTILKLLAKRLMKGGQKFTPQSESAKRLAYAPTEINYRNSVLAIAEVQYVSLDEVLEHTNQLSELNLVYVLSQEGYSLFKSEPSSSSRSTNNSGRSTSTESSSVGSSSTANQTSSSAPKPSQSNGSFQGHMRAGEVYIAQKQWSFALKELRAALQLDNHNSKCHALLGLVYMNQKLVNMAKVSFQQALKLNPKEPIAMQNIDKVNSANAQKDDKKGGFFGWLG